MDPLDLPAEFAERRRTLVQRIVGDLYGGEIELTRFEFAGRARLELRVVIDGIVVEHTAQLPPSPLPNPSIEERIIRRALEDLRAAVIDSDRIVVDVRLRAMLNDPDTPVPYAWALAAQRSLREAGKLEWRA